jgi:hypothetical protein
MARAFIAVNATSWNKGQQTCCAACRRQQQVEGGEGGQGSDAQQLQEAAQAAVLHNLPPPEDAQACAGSQVPP